MVRNTAASSGRPNTVWKVFCSARPAMPTGIVPSTIIQASRSSAVYTSR